LAPASPRITGTAPSLCQAPASLNTGTNNK
jgi:hypothetical protein